MTKIEFFKKNGSLIGYRASGHSGYSEEGSDIVCASISSALQLTLIGLQEVVKSNPEFKIYEDGFLEVFLDDNDIKNYGKEISILLESTYFFLKELAKQYPKNIKLVEKEEK